MNKRICRLLFHRDLFNPTPEHAALRDMVRNFAQKELGTSQATQHNNAETFNTEAFRKAGSLGLLGLTADEQYGGSACDATSFCIVHEELSKVDPGFCLSYLTHSCVFVNNLNMNGSDVQKRRYLPAACSGDIIGGMCMTEPTGGTDVLALKTTATRNETTGGWVLNGSKMWITNGAISQDQAGDAFLVYAKTGDTNQLSLFIVEKNFPGFEVAYKISNKCGMRASPTAALAFNDCHVPHENLVGEVGKATWCMMRNLEIERVVLAAMACGIASRCIDVMVEYASQRTAFGRKLASFGQIQRYIANSYAQLQAGRSYLYNTTNAMLLTEAGQRIDSDGVKLVCCPMAKVIADNAMQVLGANGYVADYVVERLWRDSKLLEIGGGTLESHQKNMTKDLLSQL
eukprot:TRINITY_DN67991_c4_g1_i1.p1 TRINITY_DN67991_c4_g1~~TRINITY_DN67991_c4_g1_i1.p1  ORF type:complete len:401 (-),score=36.11 TRINITY_DN67991_c4_g1_i1:479-1681(-)